jgi:hypothetical protein
MLDTFGNFPYRFFLATCSPLMLNEIPVQGRRPSASVLQGYWLNPSVSILSKNLPNSAPPKDFMRKIALLFLSLSILSASTSIANGLNMRPGLWELTTSSDLLKLIPYVPPDQMQQLVDLARQNGFDLPKIQNGAATSQFCISREMADRRIPPHFYHGQSGCTTKNTAQSGNRYRMDIVCTGPELKGNGKAEGVFTSAEGLTGRTEFIGTVRGAPVNEQAEINGRWVSASCGAVKPLQ